MFYFNGVSIYNSIYDIVQFPDLREKARAKVLNRLESTLFLIEINSFQKQPAVLLVKLV